MILIRRLDRDAAKRVRVPAVDVLSERPGPASPVNAPRVRHAAHNGAAAGVCVCLAQFVQRTLWEALE
jgi:hypothetical protein